MYKAVHFELPVNVQSMFTIDNKIYYENRFKFKLKYVRTNLNQCVYQY